MIFVTVGTHEQPFDRLLKCIDKLIENGIIQEEVVIQTGFSDYKPAHATCYKLLPAQEMQDYYEKARIIITHGGPASFMAALEIGKIPIVVPRQKQYGEHVNDHQLEFSAAVQKKYNNIITIENIDDLEGSITNYDRLTRSMHAGTPGNNEAFCGSLKKVISDLTGK